MLPYKLQTCTQTLLIVFILSFVNGQDRKIKSWNHPGCKVCEDNDVLMYTRAEGAHDTIHQIWDFTGGVPTVIYAVAGVQSQLSINWSGTTPKYFNMSEPPNYTFATAFDTLYEYNDVNDTGYIDGTSERIAIPLSHVSWRLTDTKQTDLEVMVRMRGIVDHKDITGVIDVSLDLLPFKDYAVQLPHLIHTANSSLMDISLVNLTASPGWNASRFALRAVMVSADDASDSMRYVMRKSLDDEHTPGVFEIIEIRTPESTKHGDGGFLQFRPVAYTQRERGVETSTVVHVSSFTKSKISSDTLRTFYRSADPARLLVQDMMVSFGESGDGFYKKFNYTSWSLTLGYGAPPLEGFSAFVIGIISAGLGVPLALAASGAAYVCARRRRLPRARLADE